MSTKNSKKALAQAELITALLLKFMPKAHLMELDISTSNKAEWEHHISECKTRQPHHYAAILALSLFHSTRSITSFKKARPLISELEIIPEVIYELSQIVSTEAGNDTGTLITKIYSDKEKARKNKQSSNINEPRKRRHNRAAEIAKELWTHEISAGEISRMKAMAIRVKAILVDEGHESLPDDITTIMKWIKKVAPAEAQKPGRPSKQPQNPPIRVD